jgi:type IV secretory pathway TraG/TraD family ATPase VirD4
VRDFDMQQVFDLFDRYPVISFVLFLLLCYLIGRKRRQRKAESRAYSPSYTHSSGGGLLSQVLLHWSAYDPFPIRDLLRSLVIFGASGSGKTSGSGYVIGRALAKCRQIGGIICASKPEDLEFWQGIFRKAGRARDLLVFSAASALRFNFIDFILRNGGSTRDITQAIMVIGETLNQSAGNHSHREPFWQQQKERVVYNAAEIVQRALGRVTAPELQQFIGGAAQSPAELATPEWQAKFHSQCLEAAQRNLRTSVERHDYQLALDFWIKEYPAMNDRTRSSIIAEVMGTLHVFNTGIVRELVSTTTNVSPAIVDQAKWLLIDMPISRDGAAGAFVIGGWKYLTQWHVLKRHATEDTPICVIHCDEYQKIANSKDPPFLAECRSHRGCMICLTQSIHSLYACISGSGEHETDALLTNFYHKIFHALGDDKTAAFAGSLIGKRLRMRVNTSVAPHEGGAWEALYGEPKVSASTSQSIENIVENREFMQGLRTGGPANGLVVDGVVVRSGELFSNGEAWMRVAFSQK